MRIALRVIVVVLCIGVIVAMVGWGVIHAPAVQQRIWERVSTEIEAATGWSVDADDARFRLIPGRVTIHGLSVVADGATLAAVRELEIRFRWTGLLGSPRVVDRIDVNGPLLDLTRLPKLGETSADATEPMEWTALEVGVLRIADGHIQTVAGAVGVEIHGISVQGSLEHGTARVNLECDGLWMDRDGRRLPIGSVVVQAAAGPEGARLTRLELEGEHAGLNGAGELESISELEGRAEVGFEADIAELLRWWDPAMEQRFEPSGRLIGAGFVSNHAERGLEFEVEHLGEPMKIAGLSVDRITAARRGGVTSATVGVGDHGSLGAISRAGESTQVDADLVELPLRPLTELFDHPLTENLPTDLELTTKMVATVEAPADLSTLTAAGNALLSWSAGEVDVAVAGGGSSWDVTRLDVTVPGATGTGHARVRGDAITAEVRAEVVAPDRLAAFAARWQPVVREIPIAGGPIDLDIGISGTMDDPTVRAEAVWTSPRVTNLALDEVRATVSGALDELRWKLQTTSGETSIAADGITRGDTLETEGGWRMGRGSLSDISSILDESVLEIEGRIETAGTFFWRPEEWGAGGSVDVTALDFEDLAIDHVAAEFQFGPELGSVRKGTVRVGGAVVTFDGSLAPLTTDGEIDARVRLGEIALAVLDPRLESAGRAGGEAELSGILSDPSIDAELRWIPDDRWPIAEPLELEVAVSDGVAEITTDNWATAAGPITARATLPIGDLPRPDWLWTSAPPGPARATIQGIGLRSGPVVEAVGREPLAAEVMGDLRVDAQWDLVDPPQRMLSAEIDRFAVRGRNLDIASERTVRIRFDENRLQLEPVSLRGAKGRADLGGVYDVAAGRVVGALSAELDAEILELLPFAIQGDGRIRLEAAVDGPPALPDATLIVDHQGGSLRMRDPALSLRDLQVHAEVNDGVLWINHGEAALNKGHVLVGGGWDPTSGQGVVIELENVMSIVDPGIVTSWSGVVAIEPDPQRPARIVGELGLSAGVWERPVDLGAAFFGGSDLGGVDDNPLDDVALDLQVAGYGGVRVNNNLGRFNASWGVLEVGGTVAEPQLIGTVRLAPGGVVFLPGQAMTIRRATLDFTGDPATDPVIDIVPETGSDDPTSSGDGSGATLADTRTMAARSLAQGAGSILGLENTTLQPAEIAFETQTDASSAFTAGKRLNRNVAVFFTTDLSDVQRQTTMLQFWNLQGLPGLAIQGYNRTGEAERGANLIQRYRWGGGIADDRPTIRKIRFEGEWPVSRRRLRSATGLRAGEPYEPFLVFAAALRLETALAELGYPRVRVRGETENDGRLPTVVFTVDAGPRQEFVFSGDRLPAPVRRTVIGTFRPSPTDRSFPEMERTALRHLFSEGFPDGQVTVSRHADEIVVDVTRGERITLAGPEVEGLSAGDARGLILQASDPITLAELVRDPVRARRIVERWLAVDGFPEARLEDIWVTDDSGLRTVHLNVDAGRRLQVNRIEVVGPDPLGLTAEGVPGLSAGMPLDRSTIGQSVARVRSAYRAAGYAEVRIATAIDEDVLSVTIDPGTQREVGEITVSGLRHIRESVIVNGLTIEPGEVLLPAELDRSAVRTAFFSPVEKADITTRDVGYNLTDVEVDVVEKDRWTVEAGAGWNSERGGNFQFGVGDDGLLGRGAGLSLRGQIDSRQRQLGVWAAIPPKPGSRWSTVANLLWFDGDNREDPDRLKEERIGGAIETSYRLHPSASIRGYLRAVRSEIDVHDPRDDPFDFFPITTQETVIGSLLIWDRLDNPFDPTSGYHAAVDLSHSAPSLGSDFNDLRLVLSGGLVTQHRDRWVWRQRLRLGAAKPLSGFDMSSDRLFFAGGQATVRGFELDSIGPVGPSGRVIGGESLFVLNEELHVPVWGQLGVAVFVDVGQVWETWSDADFDLSVGAGFGLRYRTPIGPLWADVAWPVANLNVSEPGAKFYFGLGTSF